VATKNDVGLAWKIKCVEAKAKTETMHKLPNSNLRHCIVRSYGGHDSGPLCLGKSFRHCYETPSMRIAGVPTASTQRLL
jgi:hypothetical protein